jgi:hypothetical protein
MKRLLVVGFILCSLLSNAQIETDRPRFTISPNVVPHKALQIESGFIWENDKEEIIGDFPGTGIWEESYRNLSINTLLLRYGLTKNLELRLNTTFRSITMTQFEVIEPGPWLPPNFQPSESAFDPQRGISSTFIGFKTNLYTSEKLSIGFLGHLHIPELTSGDFLQPLNQQIAPEFLIPVVYSLTNNLSVAAQYGIRWDGLMPNPTSVYSLALGYSINKKLKCFIEPYGFVTVNGDELHSINGGFTYLVLDKLQFDLTGGLGLNDLAPNNFVGCGVSYLIQKPK